MGRYERMICYLYEYQDGHKGANVGYVKLEKRGEKCRVLIQMRRADLATLPQAALFQQEKTGVLLIPIGVMRDNNGSMKGQYEGNVDNLAGTGLSLDDVHGVLVYVEEGHYFASTWNLEQIDARQLRWWQGDQHEDAGKAEALPEGNYTPLPDLIQSLKDIPVYGAFLDGENMYTQKLSSNGLIVMGNEGNGIGKEVEQLINRKLYIPNYPAERETSESLNVAIATAVVCAEFRRQAASL